MPELKSNRIWTCFFFVFIAAVNLVVYFPSFRHVPRADHLFYLADMAYKYDWYSLAIQSFDWSRSRTFAAGDYLIFRPGAYFLMGSEKYFFGYDFVWWQVTGWVLHLLVAGALLKILLKIRHSFLAFVMTAYFSMLFMNMETVIWHGVNSILVAVFMTLISLDQVYTYACKGQTQTWRLVLVALCMTVAGLTYEIGVIFSGLFFVFLLVSAPGGRTGKGRSLLLLLPPALYSLGSALNYMALGNKASGFVQGAPSVHIVQAVKNAFLTLAWWSYSGLFPGQYEVVHKLGRAILAQRTEIFPHMSLLSWQFLLGGGFVLCWGMLAIRTASKDFLRRRWKFLVLLVSMGFFWALVIAGIRAQERGIAFALGGTLIYHYIFWSFLVVLLYAAIDFEKIKASRFAVILRNTFLALLFVHLVFNGSLVYKMNCRVAQWYEPRWRLVRLVESLIEKEGKSPGFSFYIEKDFPGNFRYPHPLRDDVPFLKRYSFAEMIYLDYWDQEHPKYVFLSDRHPGGPKVAMTINWEK